jgi:hypothetical protein
MLKAAQIVCAAFFISVLSSMSWYFAISASKSFNKTYTIGDFFCINGHILAFVFPIKTVFSAFVCGFYIKRKSLAFSALW